MVRKFNQRHLKVTTIKLCTRTQCLITSSPPPAPLDLLLLLFNVYFMLYFIMSMKQKLEVKHKNWRFVGYLEKYRINETSCKFAIKVTSEISPETAENCNLTEIYADNGVTF